MPLSRADWIKLTIAPARLPLRNKPASHQLSALGNYVEYAAAEALLVSHLCRRE